MKQIKSLCLAKKLWKNPKKILWFEKLNKHRKRWDHVEGLKQSMAGSPWQCFKAIIGDGDRLIAIEEWHWSNEICTSEREMLYGTIWK